MTAGIAHKFGRFLAQFWFYNVTRIAKFWLYNVIRIAKFWPYNVTRIAKFWPYNVRRIAKFWLYNVTRIAKFWLYNVTRIAKFWLYNVTRTAKFPKIEKWRNIIFSPQKIHTFSSLEISIVVWSLNLAKWSQRGVAVSYLTPNILKRF